MSDLSQLSDSICSLHVILLTQIANSIHQALCWFRKPQNSGRNNVSCHVINEIVKSSSFSHHHNHHVSKLISLSNVDSWKERYIVVTRDYLQCYKRVATEASQMGPFLNQVLFTHPPYFDGFGWGKMER